MAKSVARLRKTAKRRTSRAFRIKRVYEPAARDDGLRVLVDRLWPRGIAKDKAHIDQWLKDVAPSDALRKRFHGDPEMWNEFVAAYGRELAQEPAATALANLRGSVCRTAGHAPLRGSRRNPQQCCRVEEIPGAEEAERRKRPLTAPDKT